MEQRNSLSVMSYCGSDNDFPFFDILSGWSLNIPLIGVKMFSLIRAELSSAPTSQCASHRSAQINSSSRCRHLQIWHLMGYIFWVCRWFFMLTSMANKFFYFKTLLHSKIACIRWRVVPSLLSIAISWLSVAWVMVWCSTVGKLQATTPSGRLTRSRSAPTIPP